MSGTTDVFDGQWNQLKGSIQMFWGDITDSELDRVQGSRAKFEGLLQEKYGHDVRLAEQLTDRLLQNHDQFDGAWEYVKGKAQSYWGELTGDEIERTKGSMQQLAGAIQNQYGKTLDEARDEIHAFLESIDFDSIRKQHGKLPAAQA